MIGITSMGYYIPVYRLKREEIGRMWGTKGAGGEKAVAGYDEDSITMAVAAARECLSQTDGNINESYFSSTTAPYLEKQSAAIIASVIGLNRNCHTADITNSLRSGTNALKTAVNAVKSESANQVLVTSSDCRMGIPKSRFERLFGDGAAALVIGSKGVIAEIESFNSMFSDFTDHWRNTTDHFVQSGEGRFIDDEGYIAIMTNAISELMQTHSLNPADFSRFIFSAADFKQHSRMAKKLGFDASQIQDPLFTRIGHLGTAGILIMLIASLEQAEPGDRILLANYGDGADTFIFRVTERIQEYKNSLKHEIADYLTKTRSIDYGTYLNWRNLIPLEALSLPERSEPSLAARWRERKIISTLTGVKCMKCGMLQIHSIGQNIRICVQCQAKDEFEEYTFSDKKATLFTYAIDQLQPTKNPPGLNGVIDFEEGGRLICELTDYDLETVKIGMPVEMTFRKMSEDGGIVNYFWKAKPV